jgi:hypothetical protein
MSAEVRKQKRVMDMSGDELRRRAAYRALRAGARLEVLAGRL